MLEERRRAYYDCEEVRDIPQRFVGILDGILDGTEHKLMAGARSSVTACHEICAERRESTTMKFKRMLPSSDCRAGWRDSAVFKVTTGTFAVRQQPRVVIVSCERWSSALEHYLQGAWRTPHHAYCEQM